MMDRNFLTSYRLAAACLLTLVMLVSSVVSGQRDILFPEIAGMAMGVMVFSVPHWVRRPVHLWLSPSLAAFLGTSLNELSLSPLLKLWIGFVVIVLLMHVFRVNFGPTIPAGLLPLFLGLHDYVFAISTTAFTCVIMLAAFMARKRQKLPNGPLNHRNLTDTAIISVILCLWIGFAFMTGIEVIVVPPVFALIFEVFHAEKFPWRPIPARVAVLTAAAAVAVVMHHLLPDSIVAVGIVNVLITFLLCKWFKTPVPVAFGVSLMPLIYPAWGTGWFPLGVLTTTGILMCIAAAYRQYRIRHAVRVETSNAA
ncbi:hypothetical protein GZH47_01370 [Paenibacillus rhizovicinus]|uniref:HPP family protein n=1 Tax=Paenibacillus rhizovicinus TaxID=2704463 RepID=A0A6C0NTW7_9BACL|nr:hypothetical protein [Paenibacillus rhizovicinus]QHW29615.1 hypothetical protein GZH47_01370 [Paenibacillus rhizovicinus]